MYKRVNESIVQRTSDSVCIPNDPNNSDYQEFLIWESEGNTPEPLFQPEPQEVIVQRTFDEYLTQLLNTKASEKAYADWQSCYVRAANPSSPWYDESKRFADWVEVCNSISHNKQIDYKTEGTVIPDYNTFVSFMPSFTW